VPQALVTTKLRPPKTRPKLVARPRLREALAAGEGRPLTLVSSPAGFGKTTLLGEWSERLAGDGKFVAWVSLDESDNDPAGFLSYLTGALREVEESFGEDVLAALDAPQPPPVEALVGAIVNGLDEARREVVIVLDHYHVVDSGPVHDTVVLLLRHLPENARLVISGRTDPPLPLSKLRAQGQLTELRAADLRFTPEEAASFLGGVMGLSQRDVAALAEVTERWVAALQLAVLSLRDPPSHRRTGGRDDVSFGQHAFGQASRRDARGPGTHPRTGRGARRGPRVLS
jgi:LuxR family maltose regulon positive regulatory protein